MRRIELSDRWWWVLGALLVGVLVYVISTLHAKHKLARGANIVERGFRGWRPNSAAPSDTPSAEPTEFRRAATQHPDRSGHAGPAGRVRPRHRAPAQRHTGSGVEYVNREFVNRFGQHMRAEHHDTRVNHRYSRPGSRADKVEPEVRHMVQVPIPPTPTLCLKGTVPVPKTYHNPVRYTPINDFSTDESLGDCPAGDRTFDGLLRVLCGDPQFARAVLTPDVVALMINSPWYHQRMLVLENGVLWTQQVGALPEPPQLQYDIDHLVQLVAQIPTQAWQYRAPMPGW